MKKETTPDSAMERIHTYIDYVCTYACACSVPCHMDRDVQKEYDTTEIHVKAIAEHIRLTFDAQYEIMPKKRPILEEWH